MHWAEKIAQQIIERSPNKEEYICAAGISPSGSIHIGNFRDIATSWFVVKALRKRGKKAQLLFSWDEYDRLRKIPKNIEAIFPDMNGYIGRPYVDVPNPFGDGCANYAVHFQKEFSDSISAFGIDLVYRHQAELYRSGVYARHILKALQKRGEIFDILDFFRTQDAMEGERESYYPVTIYCKKCRRDTTKITSIYAGYSEAEYECKCGHKALFNFTKDFDCKLAWKVDWPMRWMFEGVDFEPGGKDHASPGGSYQTSRVISERIFGFPAPVFQGYEFIGIKGATGKMSGSSGLNLTPAMLLKIYQPEIILWLYARSEPLKAFDFCFDDGILRQYHEFDTQYALYKSGEADELTASVIEYSLTGVSNVATVPMNLLVQLGSIVNFNVQLIRVLFNKISMEYTEDEIIERLPLAQYWVEQCAPEMKNTLRKTRNWDTFDTLTKEEKQDIDTLHTFLSSESYSLDDLSQELYGIVKLRLGGDIGKKALRKAQAKFFSNVYRLLIDKEAGPRLYLFLFAVEKRDYLQLLDFSHPKTAEEESAEVPEFETEMATEEIISPDPVVPFQPEVTFEAFLPLDIRVCKIIKCSEIRKSKNCLKLTLSDGLGERVVISSIKEYYSPETLIGRKIAVFINLEPRCITGVASHGMLLAMTNTVCGCKLLFIDDSVPEGTKIM